VLHIPPGIPPEICYPVYLVISVLNLALRLCYFHDRELSLAQGTDSQPLWRG